MGHPGEMENIWERKRFGGPGGKNLIELKNLGYENIWGKKDLIVGNHLGDERICGGKI